MRGPQSSATPPRWALGLLRVALPNDLLGDAIVGDLHEEFAHDAVRHGPARAGARYWRRVAGIVFHATIDELLLRSWSNPSSAVEMPTERASRAGASGGLAAVTAHARTSVGVGVLAFVVLAVGIAANTLLFSSVRGTPGSAAAAQGPASAIGVAAVVLSFVCAGAAAVVLCAGPRWLRRRFHQGAPLCERPPVDA
jgi:hypothetical protein